MVSRFSKKKTIVPTLHLSVLPQATQRAFRRCQNFPFLTKDGWYLAGGTALALQVGHRESVDLDFFLPKKTFSIKSIEQHLLESEKWRTTLTAAGTLYGELDGAKMSFIAYPFFRPSKARVRIDAVEILTLADIAVMKIIAISQRGRKRDFLDLYWLCTNGETLREGVARMIDQYPSINHNIPHILKSLVYFDDAEQDPMPRLFFKATWKEVKAFFRREAPCIARELLHLA